MFCLAITGCENCVCQQNIYLLAKHLYAVAYIRYHSERYCREANVVHPKSICCRLNQVPYDVQSDHDKNPTWVRSHGRICLGKTTPSKDNRRKWIFEIAVAWLFKITRLFCRR